MITSMLEQEVDFRVEGANRERLSAICERSGRSERSRFSTLYFPRVLWDFCAESIMVQEYMDDALSLADREKVEAVGIDDACMFLARFANGSMGTFESTRYARGRKNYNTFELSVDQQTALMHDRCEHARYRSRRLDRDGHRPARDDLGAAAEYVERGDGDRELRAVLEVGDFLSR
mgnify:CR=1 FL=1